MDTGSFARAQHLPVARIGHLTMTGQMDVPVESAYDVRSYALLPASRAIRDASRPTHPLKIIAGSPAQRGTHSTCFSLTLVRNRWSMTGRSERLSARRRSVRMTGSHSAWSNARESRNTALTLYPRPLYRAPNSWLAEFGGLLADLRHKVAVASVCSDCEVDLEHWTGSRGWRGCTIDRAGGIVFSYESADAVLNRAMALKTAQSADAIADEETRKK